MKNSLSLIFCLVVTIGLSGCETTNSNFDCPMKPGIRCESLDQVNAHVDRGELGNEELNRTPIYITPIQEQQNHHCTYANCLQRKPLRYDETVMRVWIAPYEDREGNYHNESEVYSVSKPGHWIGYPVKELGSEG